MAVAQDKRASELTAPVSIADTDVFPGYRPGTGGEPNLDIRASAGLIRAPILAALATGGVTVAAIGVESLSTLRAMGAVAGINFWLSEAGKEGAWALDASDTTSADNGGTVIVTTGGARYKRVHDGAIRPEWFGAKGDWVDDASDSTLGTGTDDTVAFQATTDYIIAQNRGYWLKLTSQYLVNGTVYIAPVNYNRQCPFAIRGALANQYTSLGNGIGIVRNVPGDCFRVNMDSAGNGVITGTLQYRSFTLENFGFLGRSVTSGVQVAGMVGVKMFRTRTVARGMHSTRMDYLIDQPPTDASAVENYCDMSTYENIRVQNSALGGMRLYHPDSSPITGYRFERPQTTATSGLQIYYGIGMLCKEIFVYAPPDGGYTPVADSSYLLLDHCAGMEISGVLAVRQAAFDNVISAVRCANIEISNIYEGLEARGFLQIDRSEGVKVRNWKTLVDRTGVTADVTIIGSESLCRGFEHRNAAMYNYTGGTPRDIIVSGTSNPRAEGGQSMSRFAGVSATDADLTLAISNNFVVLPQVTANRNLTLPAPSSSAPGQWLLIINNHLGTTIHWYTDGSYRPYDGTNTALNQYPDQSVIFLFWDHVNTRWRIVSVSSIGEQLQIPLWTRITASATGTVADTTAVETCSASGGAITRTLPTAVGRQNRLFTFKKTDNSVNAVTIATTSSQTIDGATTYVLSTQYQAITVISNGSNWLVIGKV